MPMYVRETPFKVFRNLGDLRAEFPNTSFPAVPNDLTSFGLKKVTEAPKPPSSTGDTVSDQIVKVGDVWEQQWTVTSPSDLTDLKNSLKLRARTIAERKMDPPLTSTEVMTYNELYRFDEDPSPTPTDYPLMAAVGAGLQISNAAAITVVRNNRQQWLDRATLVTEKLFDVIRRINLATTTAELDALEIELDAY